MKKAKNYKILEEYNPSKNVRFEEYKLIYDKSGRSRTNKSSSSEKSEPNEL